MAEDSGDKTEKPTPKRLQDARKKGDVPKSKELGSTLLLGVWLGLGGLAVGEATQRLGALFEAFFTTIGRGWAVTGFAGAVRALGMQALEAGLMLTALLLAPVAAAGLLIEFLQTGPILTFEKVKPKLENMDPVGGVKRMFSLDNLVEVLKAIIKAALLLSIGWLVLRAALPQLVGLARSPQQSPQVIGALTWDLTSRLVLWTLGVFALVAMLDFVYQRHAFEKKMRMSLRDIKQEYKESEGDPIIKQQRKQAHQEWSQRNQAQAARNANVLVVNPTHVAIAIDYDRESSPVPTIAAKGEDHVARAMREAAEEAGVPIVRNVPLARDLLKRGEPGEIVPGDLFEIIAEVILWAREVRERVEAQRREAEGEAQSPLPAPRIAAPGEDLTHYPDPSWKRS
ncbi:type III secretion system export apparatus subunit SctU [Azohydromonas caseinilytica]|uniref:Type III secretion system export apparatus subunit SctU n=1 Tax=Azohydromonas caseinilytica TaxID=2728836 RepID=A0A848FI12_9BURK|nr:type III secretion system export apparatus subunit SctU [Azohydromonas caseinilytica]NML18505.1 type III secretion system export apparatus subunit SctU [Azohydromonas caseinilytica]